MADRSPEDLQWLVANGVERRLTAGAQLVDESEQVETVFVVLDGAFTVAGSTPAHLSAGDVAGPPSITRRPPGLVTAATDAVVWAVPRERLQARIDGDASVLSRFRKVASAMTVDWMRMIRDRGRSEGASEQDALENKHVYKLIEDMLRGDLPGGSQPGPRPGRPRRGRADRDDD